MHKDDQATITIASQQPISEVKDLPLSSGLRTNDNLTNLLNYIEPTRNRAEVILHKSKNRIDEIYFKKCFHIKIIVFRIY